MSEDLNPLSGPSEEPARPLTEGAPSPVPEQGFSPAPTPSQGFAPSQQQSPLAESIVSEQPVPTPPPLQPQYPPSPEFYAQMPVVGTAGEPATGYGVPASAAFVPPVQGAPVFPPPPGYGYGFPPPGYGYAPFPLERPLPLGQALRELPGQYKKILFKPGARAFAEEQHKADWGIIWMQILFLALFNIVISIPSYFLNQTVLSTLNTTSSSSSSSTASVSFAFNTLAGSLTGAVLVPLVVFGAVGIQYLMAKMFKGTGNFKQQTYTYLLFYVPVQAVSSLISLASSSLLIRMELALFSSLNALTPTNGVTSSVPPTPSQLLGLSGPFLIILGLVEVVSLAIWVYSIILNIFSLMASQRLSGGRATGAVLIPIGVAIFLFAACYCALIFILVAAVSSAAHP